MLGATSASAGVNSQVCRSASLQAAEIAWFAPLCDDDYAYLGVPDSAYKSSLSHTLNVVRTADMLGFDNILCPSSYQVGPDTLTFAAAAATQTTRMSLLTAVRCGEVHPPMLARAIATLDHLLKGRLAINIISSDLPGEQLGSLERYAKSREVIEILKQCWTTDRLDFQGHYYQFSGLPTAPVRPYQQNGGPLLYFGGLSDAGRQLAAEHADVFLMWPETEDRLRELIMDVAERAAAYQRRLDFGLRVHVIVRETEGEARAYAEQLVSRLDPEVGRQVRERALDAQSYGVARQAAMRDLADDSGYAEPHLWTGIGRARSGCSCAIVGSPQQVVAKLQRYMDMGIRAFIFSGYPNADECRLFARLVLPHLKTCKLAAVQGRIPTCEPMTPLGAAVRV